MAKTKELDLVKACGIKKKDLIKAFTVVSKLREENNFTSDFMVALESTMTVSTPEGRYAITLVLARIAHQFLPMFTN